MSLSCQKTREALSLYIDDMLSETEAETVCSHLQTCDACREEYKMLLGMKKALSAMPQLAVSERFHAELHQKLAAEAERKARPTAVRRPLWHKLSGAAAAVAVLAVSVIALYQVPKQTELTPATMTSEPTQHATTDATDTQEQATVNTPATESIDNTTKNADTQSVAASHPPKATRQDDKTKKSAAQPTAEATQATAAAPQAETQNEAVVPQAEPTAQAVAADVAAVSETEGVALQNDGDQTTDTTGGISMYTTEPTTGRAGGGSSSSSGAARTAKVARRVWHYTFTTEGIEAAREILQTYGQENNAYLVPQSAAEDVLQALTENSGYSRRSCDASTAEDADDYVRIILSAE